MLVSFLVAIVVIAIVGYEYFVVNSLLGYTKISITPSQPYSIKFGNTVEYIYYTLPLPGPFVISPQDLTFQVSTDDSSGYFGTYFGTIQGARYSFSGLQIVVGNVTFDKIVLYVKPSGATSEAITSSVYSPTPNVTVSGTVHYCRNGTITFYWLNYQSTFISDSKYTTMLVGDRLYNVTISYQGTHEAENQFATVYVPADVTNFTANF
jgi:hypothetical protein